MIKINIKIIFLWFGLLVLLTSGSCSNEVDPNKLPTFDPITVDKDTIFLSNIKDAPKVSKIYAIDTKNSKRIYTYDFKKSVIYIQYDASFDINPYIIFLDGKLFKLETRSGTLKRINTDFIVDNISIVNDKAWIAPSKIAVEGVPQKHYIYDPKLDNLESINLPEGLFRGGWTYINNNYYFPISLDSPSGDKIYNFTTNTIIGNNFFGKQYNIYVMKKNYLSGLILSQDPSYDSWDFYYINSFEPLDGKFLFSTGRFGLLDIYERGNLVYFLDSFSGLRITIRDKTKDYAIIKTISLIDGGNYQAYCKNNYIWCVSENNDGVYKINMDDLTYEVIK